MTLLLQDLLLESARSHADRPAVFGAGEVLSYRELDELANRLAHALVMVGVGPGERVGVWLDKSPVAVAAMQAALRVGAAYVPLDPASPLERIGVVIDDAQLAAIVTSEARIALLGKTTSDPPSAIVVDGTAVGRGLGRAELASLDSGPPAVERVEPDQLAYILYTSGSTGRPKGVCISHRNALAFVGWAAETLAAGPHDRLANHAPFHFDLSVLDLYVAFRAAASVVLVPDAAAYAPERLVALLVEQQITLWYSVPSALVLMLDRGGLEQVEASRLRLRAICFAGEPFPLGHLRRLRAALPRVRLLNLYGPTETNVCTFYEVHDIEPTREGPVPIGSACSGDRVWAQREDGRVARVGEQGELMVEGPTVMLGYWGQPRPESTIYATGDIVRVEAPDLYTYVGRSDDMVKVRGHRVEPGEIETTLAQHPDIAGVAVVVIGEGVEARLVAYLAARTDQRPSLLELKALCAARLPRYMIIDRVVWLDELPTNRNGKVDRRRLASATLAQLPSRTEVVRHAGNH